MSRDDKDRLPEHDGSNRPTKEAMRPPLPKKFYKTVDTAPGRAPGYFQIRLDVRPVKTPKRRALEVPGAELADAIAAEWQAQSTVINPATMPLTRIANTAIDAVTDTMDDVRADVVAYAGSDFLCYRAEAPQQLIERQAAAWDPVLTWAQKAVGARFILSQGVMPVKQPDRALEAIAGVVAPLDPFQLSAAHVLTTLTGSALLAVAFASKAISADALWTAAHVDEDWQIELWGADEEAAERREVRRIEFNAACQVLEFVSSRGVR